MPAHFHSWKQALCISSEFHYEKWKYCTVSRKLSYENSNRKLQVGARELLYSAKLQHCETTNCSQIQQLISQLLNRALQLLLITTYKLGSISGTVALFLVIWNQIFWKIYRIFVRVIRSELCFWSAVRQKYFRYFSLKNGLCPNWSFPKLYKQALLHVLYHLPAALYSCCSNVAKSSSLKLRFIS